MKQTTVNFAGDFREGENIVFIAIKGTPESISKELSRITLNSESYGKPIQGIVVNSGSVSHVITPIWNGQKY